MSLTSRERRSLAAIEESLSASAPELVSLLAMFNRLTADEKMPAHTRMRRRPPGARRPHKSRRTLARGSQPARQRWVLERWSRACVVLWLIFSVSVVAIAVAMSGAGPQACPAPWQTACSRLVPAHGPHLPASVPSL